ncbi:hypothetical protein LXL04_008565 [Taraxacum kok-saghyz]
MEVISKGHLEGQDPAVMILLDKDCTYFAWVDPKLPNQWYKDLLMEFHSNGFGFNDGFEEFVEHRGQHVVGAIKG